MSLITPLDLFRQSTLFRAECRFLSQVTTKALLEMLQHLILALRLLRRNASLLTHINQYGWITWQQQACISETEVSLSNEN